MATIQSEQIYVYGGVVDLRKGPDGLRAILGDTALEVFYVFSNRTRALLKFLSVDATGVWCGTRRLHHAGLSGRRIRVGVSDLRVQNWRG